MGRPLKERSAPHGEAATGCRPEHDTGDGHGLVTRSDDTPCEHEVDLSYADIARIATTLAIAPSRFVALAGPAPARPTLDLGGHLAGLTLRHHRGRCVFLLTLASQRPLCGLGALAPAACLAHPTTPLPAGVDRAPSHSCQPELEARWSARVQGRAQPLDPETALAGLLSMMAEEP